MKRKKAELMSLKAQLERIGEDDAYTCAPVGRPIKRTSDTSSDAVNRPKRSRRQTTVLWSYLDSQIFYHTSNVTIISLILLYLIICNLKNPWCDDLYKFIS